MWPALEAPLGWERCGRLWLPTPKALQRRHRDDVDCPPVNVDIQVFDARTWQLLDREIGHNLSPTLGRNMIRDNFYDGSGGQVTHFAIGTDGTAADNNDAALGGEVLREALTSKSTDVLKLTCKYYLPETLANGNTIREAGLFNAASSGSMYARYVLASPIAKTSSVAVTFTWELTWTVSAMQPTERGQYHFFGGNPAAYVQGTAYPSGGIGTVTPLGIVPMYRDSADLQSGTFVVEYVVRTFNGSGAVAPTCCLVNLDDGSPDTALTGSEATGTAGNGLVQRFRSGAVTFPTAGAAKTIVPKLKTNEAAGRVSLIGASLIRTA